MEEEKKQYVSTKEDRLIQNQVHEEEIASENNFIEILYCTNNQKEQEEALTEFAQFIKSNKPNLSYLVSEFYYKIKKVLIKQYDLKEQKLELNEKQIIELLEKSLFLLDQFKKLQFKSLPFKALIQCFAIFLKNCHNYSFEKIQQIALQFWTSVEVFALKDYLELFQLRELLQNNDVINYLNNLIFQRKFAEATKIISYLNLQNKFNIKDLIKTMINQDKIMEAATLINDNDIATQRYFIDQMTTNKNASKGAKFLKQWNFDPKDFPQLNERLEKNCIRYLTRAEDWTKAEERLDQSFQGCERLLGFVVEDLVYQKKLNEAYSIAKRHKLLEINAIQKTDTLKVLQNPKQQFQYIDNPLFVKDNFGPTEENLDPSLKGSHWHLNDFGIQENQLHFISQELELEGEACKSLKSAKILGLDSEFSPAFTTFMQGGVSIFQISSPDCACIFDILTLNGSQKFQDYFYFLMSSKDIIKVGHSLKTDFSQLKKNMNLTGECMLQNYYELPALYKALNPTVKQSSLLHIAEAYLNKPISKYEQVSNWAKRPLRKSQLHYAAMDATICVKLFNIFHEIFDKDDALEELKSLQSTINITQSHQKNNNHNNLSDDEQQPEGAIENKKIDKKQQKKPKKKYQKKGKKTNIEEKKGDIVQTEEKEKVIQGEFRYSVQYKHYFAEPQKLKFLIDNMLQKLAKYLRNFGLDAEFIGEKNHNALIELAKQEERVIITRDTHFFQRKEGLPCYLLKSNDIQSQFEELHQYFQFEINQEKIHSRCVKCNNDDIIKISHDEAKKIIKWDSEEEYNRVPDFWQCTKCLQVYWEGSTWKNSKEKFETLVNKLENTHQ